MTLRDLTAPKSPELWGERPVIAPRCADCGLTCWTPPCPCAEPVPALVCSVCGVVDCPLQPEAVPPW